MRRLVEQRPAALPIPGGPPSARVVVCLGAEARHDEQCASDLAQDALLDQLTRQPYIGLRAHLEHDGEDLLGFLCRLDHLRRLARLHADRLLTQHVQAGLECVNGDRWMEVVRRGDRDAIYQLRLDQFLVVREMGNAVLLAHLLRTICVDVAHRRQIDFRHVLAAAAMAGAHAADADDADPQFPARHFRSLCRSGLCNRLCPPPAGGHKRPIFYHFRSQDSTSRRSGRQFHSVTDSSASFGASSAILPR